MSRQSLTVPATPNLQGPPLPVNRIHVDINRETLQQGYDQLLLKRNIIDYHMEEFRRAMQGTAQAPATPPAQSTPAASTPSPVTNKRSIPAASRRKMSEAAKRRHASNKQQNAKTATVASA